MLESKRRAKYKKGGEKLTAVALPDSVLHSDQPAVGALPDELFGSWKTVRSLHLTGFFSSLGSEYFFELRVRHGR
jgi:hypothetical protein